MPDKNQNWRHPDDRLRPQMPVWLYWALVDRTNEMIHTDAYEMRWWMVLQAYLEADRDFDGEMYKEIIKDLHEEDKAEMKYQEALKEADTDVPSSLQEEINRG